MQKMLLGRASKLIGILVGTDVDRFTLFASALAVAISTGFGSVALSAQSTPPAGQVSALVGRARERLRALHAEADQLVLEERTILRTLRQLELARQIAAEEARAIDAEVVAAEAAFGATDTRMRELEDERDRERPGLEARLVDVYKLGRGRYARLLLSTANVERMGQASRAVTALAARDQTRLRTFRDRLVALGHAREALDAARREVEARRQKARAAEDATLRAMAARNALVRDIDSQRDLNAKLAGELESARLRLEATVADTSGSTARVGLPIGPFRGVLPWPVEETSRHGEPSWRKASGRSGIEVVVAEGTQVHAVHDGIVAFAGSFEGFGNLVIVDHGERTYTLYGDLVEMAVGRSVRVDRGAALGRTGTTPIGSPGLYFELRIDGRPTDPVPWLSKIRAP